VYPREYFLLHKSDAVIIEGKYMMNETPAKVISLLGVALTSLAFLFAVTVTDANFSKVQVQFPDPFNPEKVMAVLDTAANSYSTFVAMNLVEPAKKDFAVAADNISWVSQNAKDGAVAMLGITQDQQPYSSGVAQNGTTPQVAGAVTTRPYRKDSGGFSINSLMAILSIQ
jgi:hypothetical protein